MEGKGVNALVGADTGSFESFRRQLLVLIRDHVYTEGEFIGVRTLATQIEDTDFRIWYATIKSGFWIWLYRRDVSVHVPCTKSRFRHGMTKATNTHNGSSSLRGSSGY